MVRLIKVSFLHWEKEIPNEPFLNQHLDGEIKVISYSEAGIEIRKIAAWLLQLNFKPKSD